METSTIIIRVIRSFEFRNIRNIVLKDVPLTITCEELLSLVFQKLPIAPGLPPPFRKYDYDTLKIEHQAHGAKTNDPVINCENDEDLILKPGKQLKDMGIKNETEISLFKMSDYMSYKGNPVLRWSSGQ